MNKKVYRVEQIRLLESLAVSQSIASEFELMSKAGKAAFDLLISKWPAAKSILVLCGKGNNGGDGLVLAKLAHEANLDVSLISLCPNSDYTGPAETAANECIAAGVNYQVYDRKLDLSADLIIDAMLGIGLKGEVNEPYSQIITQINEAEIPVFALDIPSGLEADTGNVMGVAVKADATISFIAQKQGLLTNKGPAYSGDLHCDELNLPAYLFDEVSASAEILNCNYLQHFLPKRERDAHKGRYGHVLIIGGDYGMGGAVRMAAEGAYRVGSGLVSVATRPEHVPVVCTNRPEIMCHQVATPIELEKLLEKATFVAIGPGLGQSEWAEMLLDCVLANDHPKLLDADALNLLSKKPQHSNNWILTPHPGEASRLLACHTKEIQVDRFKAVNALQEKLGGVIVLKGAGTLIKAQNVIPKICTAGNPGMASGGMGDVLSGVISGLVAQGMPLELAAEMGVMLHAKAADLAAEEGGERGLLATDLMKHLRSLANSIVNDHE